MIRPSLRDRTIREQAVNDAIRAADTAIGERAPNDQALAIIRALKELRDAKGIHNPSADRIDYLDRVQAISREAWKLAGCTQGIGSTDTPMGRLKAITSRKTWAGKRGEREAWTTEYYLDDEPITVAEIRSAGLARRPQTRTRQRKTDR